MESHLFATHLRLCVPLRKEGVTLEAKENRGETLRDKEFNDQRKEKTRVSKIEQKPLMRNGGGR